MAKLDISPDTQTDGKFDSSTFLTLRTNSETETIGGLEYKLIP